MLPFVCGFQRNLSCYTFRLCVGGGRVDCNPIKAFEQIYGGIAFESKLFLVSLFFIFYIFN